MTLQDLLTDIEIKIDKKQREAYNNDTTSQSARYYARGYLSGQSNLIKMLKKLIEEEVIL